jgi:hypothetical protein
MRCLNDKKFYSWSPSDMIYTTEKTKEHFSQTFDKFGDHFTDEIETFKLKEIFSQIKASDLKETDTLIHERIAFIENKYFTNDSWNGLLRLCNIYLNDKLNNFELIKLKLKWYGAKIDSNITSETTHCIFESE